MKTIKRKGFTLVELLVVIAILAILATVSVVGYTSFIESANVSVDEQLVTQLNNFLAAYKVNNPGDINEHNVREVTSEILELSGVESLVPKSKDNHFYFNLATDKYELVSDSTVGLTGAGMVGRLFAHADNYDYDAVPGNCFTDERKYYFVDTEGEIADVINSFYTYDSDEKFDEDAFSSFVASAGAVHGKFTELLNDCVFITNGGVYYVEGSSKTNRYFHDNDGLVIDKPLTIELEVANGVVTPFELPSNVGHIDTGSLNFTVDGTEVKTGVLFTVDMSAEEFVDVIMYDKDLAEAQFKVTDGTAKMVNEPVNNEDKYYIQVNDNKHAFDMDKHRPIQLVTENLTYLGNGNAVKLSDLFVLRNGVTSITNGTKLVIKSGNGILVDNADNPGTSDFYVNEAEHTLSVTTTDGVTSLTDISIQFTNTSGSNTITFELQNAAGVAIADTITVKVVAAKNVRDWSELSANIASNAVLLSDVEMTSGGSLAVGAQTLYGNGYKLDVTNGVNTGAGIVTLEGGVIRDIRIIGAVYSDFAVSVDDTNGSSAIYAKSGSIINSYVANCRSPLRIGGNVTVKDSVFFGGRYANIDMTGGTLTIQGTVATVSQYYKNVIGTGITAWFNNTKKTVKLDTGAVLKQYNFIENNSTITNSLPKVQYGIDLGILGFVGVTIDTAEVFKQMFTSTYSQYHFEDTNDTLYVSAGIATLDKYMDEAQTVDTLALTGFADGVYSGSVIYSYNIPAYSTLKDTLAGKGINADPLQMEARTLLNTNADNVKLFNEYQQLGNYYYPENYTFSNGSVQFKTFE